MSQMPLPQGVSPEQMAAMAQFFASLPRMDQPRPSGTLRVDQIRGVNPRYRYDFQPYPRALTPPAVIISNVDEEKRFRRTFNQSLPWNPTEAHGRMYIEQYWSVQQYPKEMQPAQVIVRSIQEEEAVLAGWRAGPSSTGGEGPIYPRWMFHPKQQAQLVSSAGAENALGKGWFPTPGEAISAAKGETLVKPEAELDRDELLAEADRRGLRINRQWPLDRLRDAVEKSRVKEEVAA